MAALRVADSLPKKMQGFAMIRVGEVGWIEKERPQLGPHDAIVAPVAVSPCTSDVHTVWAGAIGERSNMILGHEAVGEIVEVGLKPSPCEAELAGGAPLAALSQLAELCKENGTCRPGKSILEQIRPEDARQPYPAGGAAGISKSKRNGCCYCPEI